MNRFRILFLPLSLLLILCYAGCGIQDEPAVSGQPDPYQPAKSSLETQASVPVYMNASYDIEDRISDLLSKMTLEEKVGQMVQAEASTLLPEEVAKYAIGSVQSGGGHGPGDRTLEEWKEMVGEYQSAASSTRLSIPILYGVDAVHGMAKYRDAVVFPHNSGLGAANDPALMERLGEYTAREMMLCDVTWNFSPCIAMAEDIRWGRTYESYSSNPGRVSSLLSPYIKGLQNNGVIACAKHFFGDGASVWGTGSSGYFIDQGDMNSGYSNMEDHLTPYREAVKSGVRTIMISYSSIDGIKMHESASWIQGWLKDELGFTGFVVSDWEAIQQISASSYRQQIVKAVNAGIDMLMEPNTWRDAFHALKEAVNDSEISMARIDDAVTRILRVKFENGLFEKASGLDDTTVATLNEAEYIARQAVRQSLVLLKNDHDILPLRKDAKLVVLGEAADSMSIQCGGWTIGWQGMSAGQPWISGTTILQGFREIAARNGGSISTRIQDTAGTDAIILVLGERPHAEGHGDDGSMNLYDALAVSSNREVIEQARASGLPVITVLVSGRPRLVTQEIENWNAFVMAWLPGSEGGGIADVLYGYSSFSGTLPFNWPKSSGSFTEDEPGTIHQDDILFDYGYGLTY